MTGSWKMDALASSEQPHRSSKNEILPVSLHTAETKARTIADRDLIGDQNDMSHPISSSSKVQHDATCTPSSSTTTVLERPEPNSDENSNAQKKSSKDVTTTKTTTTSSTEPPYTVFTKNQKRLIVFIASWAGFFSPVSSSIYFPALNVLARDLHVSNALINLTLTSYMIFQGLAPSVVGSLADSTGRRPAYIICFTIYIAANIGLALQNSYAALFVLRCLQSTGSSPTVALASAVVSDIATPAERGKYMGFTVAGSLIGPALGPVVGGVLSQFISWRAIFWFLVIVGGSFMVLFLMFLPETARSVVGNGSIPPKGINMSLMNYLVLRKTRREAASNSSSTGDVDDASSAQQPTQAKKRSLNPLASLTILLDRSNALLLFYNGFLCAAFYDIIATIPSQYAEIYHFNNLQLGLCYIPYGTGAVCAAFLNGRLLDGNFQRWCRKLGIVADKGKNQDLSTFPIERARLEVALPATYICALLLLVYGWVLNYHGPLAVMLILLFFMSLFMTVAFNVTGTLLIDFYPTQAGTAAAANNLVRCLLGAGATAAAVPMIDGIGLGWTFTFLGLFLIVTSPMLWLLMWKGMEWRAVRDSREQAKRRERESARVGAVEEARGEGGRGDGEPGSVSVTHDSKGPSRVSHKSLFPWSKKGEGSSGGASGAGSQGEQMR